MELSPPPLQSALGQPGTWTKPWGNWLTQIWQMLAYGWQWNTVTVTANYTVHLTDTVILINGDVTVTLPPVSQVGPKRITAKVINAGAGTRTVSGNGANIDGNPSVTTTTQYMAWDFINDGSNYYIA